MTIKSSVCRQSVGDKKNAVNEMSVGALRMRCVWGAMIKSVV